MSRFAEALNKAAVRDNPGGCHPSYVEALDAIDSPDAEQICLVARIWELSPERVRQDLNLLAEQRRDAIRLATVPSD